MPSRTPQSSTVQLIAAAVDSAWRQWQRVGASTSRGVLPNNVIVDPEALIVASVRLSGHDRRLPELAEEWAVVNSDLISTGRLRVLRKDASKKSSDELGALCARVAYRTKDSRWKALATSTQIAAVTGPRQSDSRKAARPDWKLESSRMLQLRLLFGVGVKPDAIAVLIGQLDSWLDVQEVCEQTAYTAAAVRVALGDLAEAGLLESTTGHRVRFRFTRKLWGAISSEPMTGLKKALGLPSEPRWRRYKEAYSFVADWVDSFEGARPENIELYPLSVMCRDLMRRRWQLWQEIGVATEPKAPPNGDTWSDFADAFEALTRWFSAS